MDHQFRLGIFLLIVVNMVFDIVFNVFMSLSFIAKDADTIKDFVKDPEKYPKAKSVYVVMAQAIDECVPPFILQLYGTNGKFKACDTVRRWHQMKIELARCAINYLISIYVFIFTYYNFLS